jgi:hypothetical protein
MVQHNIKETHEILLLIYIEASYIVDECKILGTSLKSDETLPNFIKRKHPRKGEKKKQRAKTKV